MKYSQNSTLLKDSLVIFDECDQADDKAMEMYSLNLNPSLIEEAKNSINNLEFILEKDPEV